MKSDFTRGDIPALYYGSHPNNSDSGGIEGRTLKVGGITNLH